MKRFNYLLSEQKQLLCSTKIAQSQNHNNIVMLNELDIKNFELPERLGLVFPVHLFREPFVVEEKNERALFNY